MEIDTTLKKRKLDNMMDTEEEQNNFEEQNGKCKEDSISTHNGGKQEQDSDENIPVKVKLGKKKKKKNEEGPSITYNLVELFQEGGKRRGGTHLHFSDIRALLMLTVHGSRFSCHPTWCHVRNWMEIRKTLVLAVTGISETMFLEKKNDFKEINKFFDSPAVPVKGEGNDYDIKSALKSLLFYKMPKKLMAEKSQQFESVGEKNLTRVDLLLSQDRLLCNDFPDWNSAAKEHGVVTTRDEEELRVSPTKESEMFAIDCEMCKVAGGENALTRISVVNSNMETVFDTFVKPELEILDYLTQYSGITPALLKDVTTTLGDVQRKLKKIIKPDTIIIGHSLDFDLRAIKLHHDHVIDTSEIFQSSRGPGFKPSLKYLASHYLKEDIQGSSEGHCSIEDAKTCMHLVLMKLKYGTTFGDPLSADESIFEAITRSGKKGGMVVDKKIIGQHPYCQKGVIYSPETFVEKTNELLVESDYVFTHIKTDCHEGTDDGPQTVTKEQIIDIDTKIGRILDNLAPKTLVVLSFSGIVPRRIAAFFKDKEKRKSEEVKHTIKETRKGLAFVKITCR